MAAVALLEDIANGREFGRECVFQWLKMMTIQIAVKPSSWDSALTLALQSVVMSWFLSVIGVIDSAHIAVRAPSEIEFAYVNTKRVQSINVQVICDA